eukprot:CAMPEP_0181532782 /NCGR_PEP_ID=MMETSP1110-20121109/72802_1 /TAXON_ID=174948 /ORGANISM="Symbiodinium sp., Strain CCMP421" /LENGTH=32 /DNA_ID= /DNA_START= /DNA_END= /DNA_ORIENTATION=
MAGASSRVLCKRRVYMACGTLEKYLRPPSLSS